MNKLSGKRKLPVSPPLERFQWKFIDISTINIHSIDIDSIFSGILEKIRNGTHPSLSLRQRETSLQMQKRKIIDAVDRHRNSQIVSANQLYEYDVEDANAQYERAKRETENELIEELVVEKRRLINLQQTQQSSSISSKDRRLNTSLKSNFDELLEVPYAPLRNLRSSILAESKPDCQLSAGLSRGSGGANSKKPTHYFERSLANAEIKSDFIEILTEVKAQGEQLRSTQPKQVQSVTISEDMTTLVADGEEYHIGQEIKLFSILSQEMMSGMLVSMDSIRALVKASNGIRFSFQYALLKAGRIVICK